MFCLSVRTVSGYICGAIFPRTKDVGRNVIAPGSTPPIDSIKIYPNISLPLKGLCHQFRTD
jgi:hypothetical protein